MTNLQYQYYKLIISFFVDDTVVTYSESIDTIGISFQFFNIELGLSPGECMYLLDDFYDIIMWDTIHIFCYGLVIDDFILLW